MSEFICPKHGNVGDAVLHTPTLLKTFRVVEGFVVTEDGPAPKNEYICARCAAEMIDAAFLPLRRK